MTLSRQQIIQWARDNLPHWPTQYPPDTSPPGWSWLSTLQYGYVLINNDENDMVREDEVGMDSKGQHETNKQYQKDRDVFELDKCGGYYCRHVAAMTSEGLHSKSDIAAELGHGDMVNDRLTEENKALREALRLKGLELECLALARGASSAITELRHRDTEHDDDK